MITKNITYGVIGGARGYLNRLKYYLIQKPIAYVPNVNSKICFNSLCHN